MEGTTGATSNVVEDGIGLAVMVVVGLLAGLRVGVGSVQCIGC